MNAKEINARIALSAAISSGRHSAYRNQKDMDEILSSVNAGQEQRAAAALLTLKDRDEFLTEVLYAMKDARLKDAAKALAADMEAHKASLGAAESLLPARKKGKRVFLRYINAYAGALKSHAEAQFLSLDGRLLMPALLRGRGCIYALFQLLPYFERPEYVLHALSSATWAGISEAIDPDSLNEEEKRTLCGSGMQRSRILSTADPANIGRIVSLCAGRPDALRFFSWLSESAADWDHAIGSFNAPSDTGVCMEILSMLRDDRKAWKKALGLMDKSAYDRKLIYAMTRKLKEDAAGYLAETDGLSACMTAAWILDRKDVLSFTALAWWQEHEGSREMEACEDAVLYAMLHKWNRFLKEIPQTQELCDVAAYLDGRFKGFSANMFSTKQLLDIRRKNLLPGRDPIPGWAGMATYDQLAAIKSIRNSGNQDEALRIYQGLLSALGTETASKRLNEFLGACKAMRRPGGWGDEQIKEITELLIQRDLDAWGRAVFRFRAPHGLVAEALPYLKSLPALSEAKDEEEARFVLRNPEISRSGLKAALESFCAQDEEALKVKSFLGLEDGFYERHKEASSRFLMQNAGIVCRYLDRSSCNRGQFRLIVKAAMCGRLNELKFHEGDLDREIGFAVPEGLRGPGKRI